MTSQFTKSPTSVSDQVKNLELTLEVIRGENESLRKDNEDLIKLGEQREKRIKYLTDDQEKLIWNLAGCSTYAMGYGLDEPFAEEWARPALKDVLKLSKKYERLKKLVEEYLVAIDEAPASTWDKQCKALVALAEAVSVSLPDETTKPDKKKGVTFMDWWKIQIVRWDYKSSAVAWSACRLATLDAVKDYFYGLGRSVSAGLVEDLIRSFKDEEE